MATGGGPAAERLVVMWDYGAFPVWPDGGRRTGFSSLPLPISAALREQLQAWSDERTTVMMRSLRESPAVPGEPPPAEVERAWDQRGRVLLSRLRAELGPGFVVGYRPQGTGDVEWAEEA